MAADQVGNAGNDPIQTGKAIAKVIQNGQMNQNNLAVDSNKSALRKAISEAKAIDQETRNKLVESLDKATTSQGVEEVLRQVNDKLNGSVFGSTGIGIAAVGEKVDALGKAGQQSQPAPASPASPAPAAPTPAQPNPPATPPANVNMTIHGAPQTFNLTSNTDLDKLGIRQGMTTQQATTALQRSGVQNQSQIDAALKILQEHHIIGG